MRLIQAYVFGQLLGPTALAVAALSGVALLSQGIAAMGVIVDQRQSPLLLAKIALLAMPQLIVLILPIAVLAAGLATMNRLHTEHEIVVCFAAGASRWGVISPAIRLSVVVALLSLALSLWVQPLSYRALRDTLQRVRADLAASMVKPGRFTHPAPGLTVYAQSVDDEGTLHNLFIDHESSRGRELTITAREGRIERRGGAPMLVMRQGSDQEFSPSGAFTFLSFDEYVFDLRPLVNVDRGVRYKLSDRYPHELFFPDRTEPWERQNLSRLQAEGHSRFSASLYNVAFMFLALAAVLGGPFSRLGYGARIAAAAGVAVLVRMVGFAAQAAAEADPWFNLLQYAVPLLAAGASGRILLRRPLSRGRVASLAPAGGGA